MRRPRLTAGDARLDEVLADNARLRGELARIRAEQHALEERLRRSHAPGSIARVAASVGHDIGNLVTVIAGHSRQLLLGLDPSDESLRGRVEGIQSAAERGVALTQRLLALIRHDVTPAAVIDLNDLVIRIEPALRLLAGAQSRVVVRLGPRLGRVAGAVPDFEQVLINLVVNAREAMPEGGQIAVSTANVDVEEERTELSGSVARGRYVALTVADTGPGMDVGTQARVFEPYFTTKAGPGRGLGLAIAHDVVARHGGSIRVTSGVERGAVFEVFLPRVADDVPDTIGTPRPATVLIVDDEPQVRELMRDVLGGHGYGVLEAGSGAEAIEVAHRHEGPIDLVIADVVMPGTAGEALVARLATGRPGLKAVYMSGHAEDAVIHHGLVGRGAAFLEKPFSLATLTRVVREALGR